MPEQSAHQEPDSLPERHHAAFVSGYAIGSHGTVSPRRARARSIAILPMLARYLFAVLLPVVSTRNRCINQNMQQHDYGDSNDRANDQEVYRSRHFIHYHGPQRHWHLSLSSPQFRHHMPCSSY